MECEFCQTKHFSLVEFQSHLNARVQSCRASYIEKYGENYMDKIKEKFDVNITKSTGNESGECPKNIDLVHTEYWLVF